MKFLIMRWSLYSELKSGEEPDPTCAWRLPRYWYVLGEQVGRSIPFPRRISGALI
jgi:hypothetical protein